MSDFPQLQPSGRVFTEGDYPFTPFAGYSGSEVRVRHSSVSLGHRLRLSFIALEESDAAGILDHYNEQAGTWRTFGLPVDAWSGVIAADYEPAGLRWRYASPPRIEDRPCRPDGSHLYFVSVELVATFAGAISPGDVTWFASVALSVDPLLAASLVVTATFLHGAPLLVSPLNVTATFVSFPIVLLEASASFTHDAPVVGDSDANAYIAAVEAADGQALEAGVKTAFNTFISGLKSDGIWDDIKVLVVLAGARTLSGALVPIKGPTPTNNSFVSGDYNRETGLIGNASSKWIDTNYANNAGDHGQNDRHFSVYISSRSGANSCNIGAGSDIATTGASHLLANGAGAGSINVAATSSTNWYLTSINPSGFFGINRAASGTFTVRYNGGNNTLSATSSAPTSDNYGVFVMNSSSRKYFAGNRLACYTIGDATTLATLDSRITTLISDLAAAIV